MSYQKGNLTGWIAIATDGSTMADFKANPTDIQWACICPEELDIKFDKQTDTRNPICKPGPIDVVTGISGSVSASGGFIVENEGVAYLFRNRSELETVLLMTVDTILSGNGNDEPMTEEPQVGVFEGVAVTEFMIAGGETREFSLDVTNADYINNISQDYIPECIRENLTLSKLVTADAQLQVPVGTTVDEAYLIANANLKYSGFSLETAPTFSSNPDPIDTTTPGTLIYTITYTGVDGSASTTIEITVI